jgi:Cu/Ag efflux pump CusA
VFFDANGEGGISVTEKMPIKIQAVKEKMKEVKKGLPEGVTLKRP